MAPVKNMEEVSSTASSEALDLLGCFHNGIDDLVYKLAEEIAREREKGSEGTAARPVQIEAADMKNAGDRVLVALKEMVNSGRLPADLAPALESMQTCFERHAR